VFAPSGAFAFAARHGAKAHDNLSELLASADVLDICTPTATHNDLVAAGIEAGIDVICEKPLVSDPAQARALVDAARSAARVLLPAHVVRYFDAYNQAHEAVRAGRLGRLAVLRFTRGGEAPVADWYADESNSGGILLDQMIHDFDQALWFAGPAVQVFASIAASAGTTTAHVVLTHESGAVSHCRGHWGERGTAFRYGFDLAGTGGTLQFDSTTNTGMTLRRPSAGGGSFDGLIHSRHLTGDPYETQLRDLLRTIMTGKPSRVEAEDAVAAVAVAVAAIKSAKQGVSVAIEPSKSKVH
jgi:myo-inositol 2-dehydrogenase/D-chiro-inositol 1-dehydrogenase